MKKFSLTALARDQLDRAGAESSGRSATTVVGGHECVLRQTVIALRQGQTLDDHDNSADDATLHVLSGRIKLTAGTDSWIGRSGDLLVIPPAVHAVSALEDSTLLLTVAKKP
ncbi:cupin domain-containing protein [Mycolicibacter kumamotonensis]|jgi:quercetin dioxygenase-like cupin family protein|uniref:Cupin domain-containing protein n=1 Tax=Mycolicibacter kumamotonensis TaxID=354243 RepID=A0A1B8SHC6_9MYCO|nr:cupin domain-containing protein [Mycolicibacter kumamotonensis]NDJ89889.1 cupin domain-containing protein [Mycolicibacter kumamotonensis]OBY32113.1 LuxR family transcriptional regulator [Mycolicibacter kumamotonensis]ORA80121.1 LuxR family transcriptional regulator [Mycolicibacter kumamotonensis]